MTIQVFLTTRIPHTLHVIRSEPSHQAHLENQLLSLILALGTTYKRVGHYIMLKTQHKHDYIKALDIRLNKTHLYLDVSLMAYSPQFQFYFMQNYTYSI
jgi:hypothetical protein